MNRSLPTRVVWLVAALAVPLCAATASAWTALTVEDDPLVRLPGTQPADSVSLDGAGQCMNCHDNYDTNVDIGHHWRGSMMSQALRDPLFWAAVTVAAQDSIWAVGRPNAADLCLRCHSPGGWLQGRSDPSNGSGFSGDDHDGVHCESCHKLYDPFFDDTHTGVREGNDWIGYWDEIGGSSTLSATAALTTYNADAAEAATAEYFNGNPFYDGGNQPISTGWTEHGGGSFFMASAAERRSSFADANANHSMLYSRHNKSRYFCASCHDVSNSVLANLAYDGTAPGDGTTVLPSESQPAHSFGHIERTFSEFMLSDYGNGAGIVGRGAFDPNTFTTSRSNNAIATCQDCHMADRVGKGCNKNNGVVRPTGSTEHPKSGQPLHDMTGGNMWVAWLLASSQPGSPNYDAFNAQLLGQGSGVLTLDLNAGEGVDAGALLDGVNRAQGMLQSAAAITNLSYNNGSGAVVFRVENDTGHKLISGYPEGRRMFANVRVYLNGAVIYEVNPYDGGAGTLKGLPLSWSPNSPPLGAGEVHEDPLVYEVTQSSSLTGEGHTFHIALATERYKDNRIPPVGFRINEAAARLAQPYQGGAPALGLFTSAEYAGGYDEVQLTVPSGADGVLVSLYYQTTSREYVEFLRDEINGTATTLSTPVPSGESAAYIVQTDPFFNQLAAWGTTIWQLWDHNRNVPGAAPVLMTQAVFGDISGPCAAPNSDGQPCNDGDACTTGDACLNSLCVSGNPVVCTPLDDCHDAGLCNSQTGVCTDPVKPNGSVCPGGTCQSGVCIPSGTGGGGGLGGQGGVGGFGGAGGSTSSGGGAGGSTSSGTAGAGGAASSGTAGAGGAASSGGAGGAASSGGGAGGAASSGTAGAGGSTSSSSTSTGTGGTTSSSSTSGTGGAATPVEPEFEGGCDCRAVSRDSRPARWWLLASLALGLAGRRRSGRPTA